MNPVLVPRHVKEPRALRHAATNEHPKIREECQTSPACASLKHHFDKCQEKVQAGEGFKGEECIEEMFHMMHCSEACAAPKVFAKLR
ncbi:ubiquinol-cytochrome C reductase hinge protein-domain-containing protein [Mycena polygramma]|nr:ubiquinol-cytochrome C reductase hinge protein-domain-containing protein [Mycena polygramma]